MTLFGLSLSTPLPCEAPAARLGLLPFQKGCLINCRPLSFQPSVRCLLLAAITDIAQLLPTNLDMSMHSIWDAQTGNQMSLAYIP